MARGAAPDDVYVGHVVKSAAQVRSCRHLAICWISLKPGQGAGIIVEHA
jgi:hypothetical protein